MHNIIKELRQVKADYCVTIILNTHRIAPDNEQDRISLKKMVSEAEHRLLELDEKRTVLPTITTLHSFTDEINHNKNLASLLVFVNEETSKLIRLPIEVEDRVIIDNNFATRDVIRALHQDMGYYLLLLSHKEAKLLEAHNDRFVSEIRGDFPIENKTLYSTSHQEIANAPRQANLLSEFFNRIDKAVQQRRKIHPLPVVVCSEESNYHEFMKMVDHAGFYKDFFVHGNYFNKPSHTTVTEAWHKVKEGIENNILKKKNQLEQAVGSGNFLSDTSEIYRAIKEGRIDTLFIEENLFQRARIENDSIIYVDDEADDNQEIFDDIFDELIELNMDYGGEVVFLPQGMLEKFNGFGAITRY